MPNATAKSLVEPVASDWETATRTHQFIQDVNQGAIAEAAFNQWLAQDYIFVRHFAKLLGSMIAGCPDKHLDVLLGGAAAVDAEVKWFRAKAKERGINLDRTGPQQATGDYCEFLASLVSQPYAAQAAAFWAMEAAYNQAWTNAGEGLANPAYQEFVDRWGSADFKAYVSALEANADQALSSATPEARDLAAAAVKRAVELENAFWTMALETKAAPAKAGGAGLFGALQEMGAKAAADAQSMANAIKSKAEHDMAAFQKQQGAAQAAAAKPAEQGA